MYSVFQEVLKALYVQLNNINFPKTEEGRQRESNIFKKKIRLTVRVIISELDQLAGAIAKQKLDDISDTKKYPNRENVFSVILPKSITNA